MTAPRQTPPSLPDMLARMERGQIVQLIAGSPEAPVAREIFARLPELAARGVRVEAIFAQAGSNALVRLAADHGANVPVRVMDLAEQGEITEQVNFGTAAVWTGRKIRLAPAAFADGTLNVSSEGSDKAKMAAMAFRALRAVAKAPVAVRPAANDAVAIAGRRRAG